MFVIEIMSEHLYRNLVDSNSQLFFLLAIFWMGFSFLLLVYYLIVCVYLICLHFCYTIGIIMTKKRKRLYTFAGNANKIYLGVGRFLGIN